MDHFLQSLLAFGTYFVCAIALLSAFIFIYERFTPYREFELIAQDNNAAAIALGGAVLGFTFPLMASIYYTQSLVEMALWAGITGFIQLCIYTVLRSRAKQIESGETAPAIFLAALAVAVGLLNAVCISH